jgi:hypothetical protein
VHLQAMQARLSDRQVHLQAMQARLSDRQVHLQAMQARLRGLQARLHGRLPPSSPRHALGNPTRLRPQL